jgi:hypothetical protein
MSGVRQVVRLHDIPLDPKEGLRMAIPRQFLDQEPDPQRILEMWEKFVKVTNDLCRTRRSRLSNKHWKRAAFLNGMEKICLDFSRRTQNVKVEFHHRKEAKQSRPKTKYSVKIVRLSDIHANVLNPGQSYIAEIPEREQEAQEAHAQLVGDDPYSNYTDPNLPPTAIPVEIIEDSLDHRRGVRQQDTTVHMMLEPQSYTNAPLTSEVVAIDTNDDDDTSSISCPPSNSSNTNRQQKTVLQRMQELDSIRSFLTVEEYTTKRQAILDSI